MFASFDAKRATYTAERDLKRREDQRAAQGLLSLQEASAGQRPPPEAPHQQQMQPAAKPAASSSGLAVPVPEPSPEPTAPAPTPPGSFQQPRRQGDTQEIVYPASDPEE